MCGMLFEVEYLSIFEFMFENNNLKSGVQVGSFEDKSQR
jgi:hypothetical protein